LKRCSFHGDAPFNEKMRGIWQRNHAPLEHFPEKWTPVFRQGNATNIESRALSVHGTCDFMVNLNGKRSRMHDRHGDRLTRARYELKSASGQEDFGMASMSIGEAARKAGLRPSTIRYYEKLGLLPKPPRTSGRRQYGDDVVQRLAMVRFAKHVGLSIVEIKLLLDGVHGRPPTERWRKLAREKAAQVDEFIAHARVVREMLQETLDHQCPKLVERGAALPPSKWSLSTRARRRPAAPLLPTTSSRRPKR
jgi:MerR family redox-sensitive transcriptional activator SoxR